MADDPNPNERLEKMIQALATVSATDQVMSNKQAHQLVEELRERVQGVVSTTKLQLDEAEQRKKLAADIDRLVDSVSNIQSDVGKAFAHSSDKLKASVRADTIGKMAEALHLISEWLGAPTVENQARVEQLVENLRAITGADPFLDDKKAQAKLDAEIEANVKKSLDEIFGDLKIKPPL
jgi:hypothetical protein